MKKFFCHGKNGFCDETPDKEGNINCTGNYTICRNFDARGGEYRETEERSNYNRHEVAVLIAEAIGDDCACNVNGNDEWLPQFCEFAEKECPNVAGVACWEQYLKYLGKKGEHSGTDT